MQRMDGGTYVLVPRQSNAPKRIRNWLPRKERWYKTRTANSVHHIHWKPWHGLWVVRRCPLDAAGDTEAVETPREKGRAMKRLKVSEGEGLPALAVSAKSEVFKKFPRILEHTTATAYEDGSIRTPGYFWVKPTTSQWVITLFDPDAGARLDCRAATCDEALALAEKWLGVEDAPWEIDEWLRERMAKKRGKKRA
jgi:hypothetical protein